MLLLKNKGISEGRKININMLQNDRLTENETQRQYEFMEKASGYVAELAEKLGRKPTCCVTTFGCQMNARDSEKLVGILEKVGYELIE